MTWGSPRRRRLLVRARAGAAARRPDARGRRAPRGHELSSEERDRLHAEFLASPEGRTFATDSDGAWVASLAIDFCAGYTDGDPLRWSPLVVELFMTDWIPRKVLKLPGCSTACLWRVTPGCASRLADAGSRAGHQPDSSVDRQVGGGDGPPGVGSGGRRTVQAVAGGGAGSRVDFADEQALGTFIQGLNARSELDLADLEVPQAIEPDEILQLKIRLKGISKPPVWRRVQVRADTTRQASFRPRRRSRCPTRGPGRRSAVF